MNYSYSVPTGGYLKKITILLHCLIFFHCNSVPLKLAFFDTNNFPGRIFLFDYILKKILYEPCL